MITALGPLLLLVFWSVSYVLQCVRVLEAPAVPVRLTYATPGGNLTLRAASYALTPTAGFFRLTQPSIIDPAGRTLISVRSVEVSGLRTLTSPSPALKVNVVGVRGKVVRLPSGKFEVEKYLVTQKKEKSAMAFELAIHDVDLELVDQHEGKQLLLPVRSRLAQVAGSGDDWLAQATLSMANVGTVPFTARYQALKGYQAKVFTQKLNITSILNYLVESHQLGLEPHSRAVAEGLVVDGPVQLTLAPKGQIKVEGQLAVEARAATYNQYQARNVRFLGRVTEAGMQGRLDAVADGVTASLDGSASWANAPVRIAGRINAQASNARSLPRWAAVYLPKDTSFRQASFSGWLDANERGDAKGNGELTAQTASYAKEQVEGLQAGVQFSGVNVIATIRKATYENQPIHGLVAIDRRSMAITGSGTTDQLPIARFAAKYGAKGLEGTGSVTATLGGTTARPEIDFIASGNATYAPDARPTNPKSGRFELGVFEIDGHYGDQLLRINRSVVRGPVGLFEASGTVSTGRIANETDAVGITFRGRRLDPGRLVPDLLGQANIVGQVSGSPAKPLLTAYFEAYNLQISGRSVPSLQADLVANRTKLDFRNLKAVSGTAELNGQGTVQYQGQRLLADLTAKGLSLADLIPKEDGLAGSVDLDKIAVKGTLNAPTVVAHVAGDDLVVKGVKVVQLSADILGNRHGLRLPNAKITADGGVINLKGRYDLEKQTGDFEADADHLSLEPISKSLSDAVTVAGSLNGKVTGGFSSTGLTELAASGDLAKVKLNGTGLGDGPWSVKRDQAGYVADVRIGSLERYVEIEKARFDPATRKTQGTAWLHNISAADLLGIGSKYTTGLPAETQLALKDLEGSLNLGLKLSGDIDQPDLNLDSFELSGLAYRDVAIGTLNAAGTRVGKLWTLSQFALAGPVGNVSFSGTATEGGETDLSGDVVNVSLTELGRAIPGLGIVGGKLRDLSFVARGPTKSPVIRASANLEGLFGKSDPAHPGLAVGLGDIRISESEGISVDGNLSYRGIEGTLQARAPFAYPFKIPSGGQIKAMVAVPNRSLDAVTTYIPSINPKQTKGTIGGEFVAEGNLEAINYRGKLEVKADQIGFMLPKRFTDQDRPGGPDLVPVEDGLRHVVTTVELASGKVIASGHGLSSRGGGVDFSVSTPLGALESLTTLGEEGGNPFLKNPVSGSVKFSDLSLRQAFKGGTYVAATLGGEVQLDGTIGEPRFVTPQPLQLSKVDSVLPTFEPPTGEGSAPIIDPKFETAVVLAGPAKLRTSGAEIYLLGQGRLTGTLSAPMGRANFEVERGTLSLPGGRVRLEQGGTVDFNLDSSSAETELRALVDMEGRTSLTALRFGDTYERYDITLGITGDLLKDGGLNLTASSDPSDLSKDRILSLLGQTELLDTLNSGSKTSNTERRIRNALAGYALPAISDSFTTKVAQGLGLDYVNFEYNASEEASVLFAKALGNGYYFQGQRQVTQAQVGFRQRFDLRLVYRPRRIRGAQNRISFSIGADQDRPIKAAIEYSVRF